MICDNCGKKISRNDKFCPNCGCVIEKPKIVLSSKMLCTIAIIMVIIILSFIYNFLLKPSEDDIRNAIPNEVYMYSLDGEGFSSNYESIYIDSIKKVKGGFHVKCELEVDDDVMTRTLFVDMELIKNNNWKAKKIDYFSKKISLKTSYNKEKIRVNIFGEDGEYQYKITEEDIEGDNYKQTVLLYLWTNTTVEAMVNGTVKEDTRGDSLEYMWDYNVILPDDFKNSCDVVVCEDINTAVISALSDEKIYDYVESLEGYGRDTVLVYGEPGKRFVEAGGKNGEFSDFINDYLEENIFLIDKKGLLKDFNANYDHGKGVPQRWSVTIGEDYKPNIYIATADDDKAYKIQPVIDDSYR